MDREATWRNLSMLYRRKISELGSQIRLLDAKPRVSDLDKKILEYQQALGVEPQIVRLGGGDGLIGGNNDASR